MNETVEAEMLAEYDFSKGVRGKHVKDMSKPYSVTVHHEDGTSVTTIHTAPYLIPIDPDIQQYFPDAEAVNRALRGLIALIPQPRPEEAPVKTEREEHSTPLPA